MLPQLVPNPANEWVSVAVDGLPGHGWAARMYALSGQAVEKRFRVANGYLVTNVGHLPPGVYAVVIENAHYRFVRRLVVQ